MCGFVGYAGPEPKISRQKLVHMRDTLQHRGPDDAGIWLGQGRGACVGLAHRRLAILDTSQAGRQPMASEDGQIQLVFNGEFYGYATAKHTLERLGHRFRTSTDTEVILALYQQYGMDFVDHLDGMFALALWDGTQERLILLRDRLGIKPLFVAHVQPNTMIFGSEIKAVLASGLVDNAIDLQAHHDYLGLNYVPGPRTMFAGIKKVNPGELVIWTPAQCEQRTYWQHPLEADLPIHPPKPFSVAAEEVHMALCEAVERRMVSDVPIGMFLSGGIDSTAILMAMAQHSTAPIKAFTIRFQEDSYDESSHASTAARAFGAEHYIETVRPHVDTFLEPLTSMLDEPFADSSAIPLWYLCRMTRQHVKVALGGDGGDEVFAGYRTHFAWKLAKAWRHVPKVVQHTVAPRLAQRLPVSHRKVSLDLKIKAFVSAASHPAIDAHYFFKQFMTEHARRELVEHDETLEETIRLFRRAVESMHDPGSLRAILRADFALYLPDDILTKVDRMSMAHALEARVPFLDVALGQQIATYPSRHLLKGFTTKAVLKKSMRGRVPDQILDRRKSGFNVPMAQWLSGSMKPLMLDLLATDTIRRVGLWRPTVIEKIIDEHLRRQRDHSRTLWALMCFMLFNERFRGGQSA
ncbi:MAG: asparagine synthase (glutamine-hydrolyzing) [Myxococcota bacterium]|nr:asparagine synthase (glutamine-hydrolyzing) [Myxococcota bacterium]